MNYSCPRLDNEAMSYLKALEWMEGPIEIGESQGGEKNLNIPLLPQAYCHS